MSDDSEKTGTGTGTDPLLGRAMQELRALVEEAGRQGISEHTTASLATADRDARPSVRTIYIVAHDPEGLVFFANMESGKGKQMSENPRAALCFFWAPMHRQVIVEGDLEVLPDSRCDELWRKRSRESHLAAWVSEQSSEFVEPEVRDQRRKAVRGQHGFNQLQRPPHWKAILVRPDRFEFWKTGWRQLRSRQRYQKNDDGTWTEFEENP